MMAIFVKVPHKGATGATPENHENFAARKIAAKNAKYREEKGKILGAPPFGRGLIHQTRKRNRLFPTV